MESETDNQNPNNIEPTLYDVLNSVLSMGSNRELSLGTLTGFRDIDEHLLPPAPALIVVAGCPQMGRSALLHGIATARRRQSSVIYSLDLTKEFVALRIMCAMGRFEVVSFRFGYVSGSDLSRISDVYDDLKESKLDIVDDFDMTLKSIRADLTTRQGERKPQYVFIDGLELMGYRPGDEMDEALAELRRMSRDFLCSIFVGLPVSNSVLKRPNRRPNFPDLTIAPMAEIYSDATLFVFRDEVYNVETNSPGIAEITIAKNKSGPVGTRKLQFHSGHMRFDDLVPEGV